MMEALASKTTAWEKERGVGFNYDGICLLSMLEEYSILRQEKEQEQRRQRNRRHFLGRNQALPSNQVPKRFPEFPLEMQIGDCLLVEHRCILENLIHTMHAKHGSAMATPASCPIRKDDGLTALAAGRKVPMIRQPFSPVTAFSSQANVANDLEELNIAHNKAPVKVGLSNNMLLNHLNRCIELAVRKEKGGKGGRTLCFCYRESKSGGGIPH